MSERVRALITRRSFALVLGSALVACGFTPALAAGDAAAERYVSQIADEVMALANSGARGDGLRNRFSALLNRYVNLRNIATFALGPYQNKIPPGDKAEFYRLFSNYAAALFVYYADDFKGNKLDVISTTRQGDSVTIQSAIVGNGREQVKWRLVPSGGSYRISDLNIKGVWLTIATKKRFGDVLNKSKGDFSVLFDELRKAETW
jgi:ABC-type transporter MlaC component